MDDAFDQPLTDFQADLDRIGQLLSLMGRMKQFGSLEVPEGGEGIGFILASHELRDAIRTHSSDFPVLAGSLLLYVAGRFEHFVKALLQALCDGYASKCNNFGELPDKMQKSLNWYTAEVCRDYAKYGYDEVAAFSFMSVLVESRRAAGGPISVNGSCLTITSNNMRPNILNELFKRVGIDTLWADISKQAEVKSFFATDQDALAERGAKSSLEELMELRNNIAHPSANPAFPDLGAIEKYSDFLRVLGRAISLVSKMYLAAFKPS